MQFLSYNTLSLNNNNLLINMFKYQMLLCELLQLLYCSVLFLCNFGPICNIVIYFLLV